MFPELKRYTSFAILLGIVALGASGLDAVRSTHEAQVADVSSAAAETTNTANSVSAELGKLTGSLYQNATAPQNTRAPEAAQLAAASSRASLGFGAHHQRLPIGRHRRYRWRPGRNHCPQSGQTRVGGEATAPRRPSLASKWPADSIAAGYEKADILRP